MKIVIYLNKQLIGGLIVLLVILGMCGCKTYSFNHVVYTKYEQADEAVNKYYSSLESTIPISEEAMSLTIVAVRPDVKFIRSNWIKVAGNKNSLSHKQYLFLTNALLKDADYIINYLEKSRMFSSVQVVRADENAENLLPSSIKDVQGDYWFMKNASGNWIFKEFPNGEEVVISMPSGVDGEELIRAFMDNVKNVMKERK